MKNIEIEIKLKLDQPEILLNWLEKHAKLIKETKQTDHYFDPPHKSSIYKNKWDGTKDADEWFRIRETEKGNAICYKHWHRDPETGKSLYADEIETSTGDKKQMLEIFKRLGFQETASTHKKRKSYRYQDFKFDCDEVDGLGFFVEIEFKGELADPAQGQQKIFDFLKEINLTGWQKTKRGYQWMEWNPEENHFEA